MGLPFNEVICGDCSEVMRTWPADSVDLVVTSPPYWGLRDYGAETIRIWGGLPECDHEWEGIVKHRSAGGPQVPQSINPRNISVVKAQRDTISNLCSKCGAWRGSLGLEPHPQLFIDHLVEICGDIKRVLKPTGTFWLNLGDTFYGSGGKGGQYEKFMTEKGQPAHYRQSSKARSNWLQPKQKLMMPARIAIALQHDGWILRSDIIWHKPNHMPSPVKDRLTTAYEHVFLFAKARRYYFDLDAIRQPHKDASLKRYKSSLKIYGNKDDGASRNDFGREMQDAWSPLGKNPGDLWRIPTKPFPAAHFATFPPKLIEPIVKAGCPEKGVVLDPFCGSGTALRVARRLGRRFIGIDMVPEYVEMAHRRVRGDRYREPPEGVDILDKKVRR